MLKDYERIIDYHPKKENMVVDALSRKSLLTLSYIKSSYVLLLLELKYLMVALEIDDFDAFVKNFTVRPSLMDNIREKQS